MILHIEQHLHNPFIYYTSLIIVNNRNVIWKSVDGRVEGGGWREGWLFSVSTLMHPAPLVSRLRYD